MARTAVAAPAADPWEDIFETIDAMTPVQLTAFITRFRLRYLDELPPDRIEIDRDGYGTIEKWFRTRPGPDDIFLKETLG